MLVDNRLVQPDVHGHGRWAAALEQDGYCIIPHVIASDLVRALHDDLRERFFRTPYCDGDFYGRSTKRFGALLKRSPHADAFVRNPLILDIARSVLGPFCDCLQLNLTQGIELHPGAEEQPAHRDQDMWRGPKGAIEYLLNVMWPLSPFTAENGATAVWPGSHRDQGNYVLPREQAIAAEMKPGSALVFLGSTLHAGGANRTRTVRTGMIISYCLGWLKPFENQWLAYPPEIARTFSPELARLIGYAVHRPNLGNYEGQCPSVLLNGVPEEYLPAVDALPPEHVEFIAQLKRNRSQADKQILR
jgi:ectoine hydroxylase-related dioxygenase (phytanoyl-CoA dioxygenase family)